jgi:hypothetical protein
VNEFATGGRVRITLECTPTPQHDPCRVRHPGRPRFGPSRDWRGPSYTSIFETQSAEIGEMRAFLADMGIADAGEDRSSAVGDRPDFGLDGDRRIPLTPANDLEFVDFFTIHHQMAMEMAEHEVAHGENPEVIALAGGDNAGSGRRGRDHGRRPGLDCWKRQPSTHAQRSPCGCGDDGDDGRYRHLDGPDLLDGDDTASCRGPANGASLSPSRAK